MSGSMLANTVEVITAYNAFVEQQKQLIAENNTIATFALGVFNDTYTELYTKVPADAVPELTTKQYTACGWTALYDALGSAIASMAGEKKVIFFIETDGMENASKEYSREAVMQLVKERKQDGWEFIFSGADLSREVTQDLASAVNISKTVAFDKSQMGYATRNMAYAEATNTYLKGK